MKACILLASILCFFGCNKNDPNPVMPEDNQVHLAGVLQTSTGNYVASYWKNDIYRDLTADSIASVVSSLSVSGSSVLIGGRIFGSYSYPRPQRTGAVFWQNGEETIISDTYWKGSAFVGSIDNSVVGVWRNDSLEWVFNKGGITQQILDTASFFPTAIAVVGEDLFTVGNAKGYIGNHLDWSNMYAQCWKNGQLIFRESTRSYVSSIFIHQNDVYMAGYISNSIYGNTACYWKNGQRINLADGNYPGSTARSIFVTDSSVYVSGELNSLGVYWKDGVANIVAFAASANSIFVKGTDVYVAGSHDEHPVYWKNGIKQKIPNEEKKGRIDFIVVGSN